MKTSIVTGLLFAMTAHSIAFAQDAADPVNSAERPRIGVALSGGGSRGGALIGVLKVLEESRVPVDFIAGTSVGAIVGGFYAAGLSPRDIAKELGLEVIGYDIFDILTNYWQVQLDRPRALYDRLQKFEPIPECFK